MAPPPPATTGLRPLVPLGGGEGGEREGEGGGGGARVAPRTPAGASREGRGGEAKGSLEREREPCLFFHKTSRRAL